KRPHRALDRCGAETFGDSLGNRFDQILGIHAALYRFCADWIALHQSSGEFQGGAAAARLGFRKQFDFVEAGVSYEFADQLRIVKTKRQLVKRRWVMIEEGGNRCVRDLGERVRLERIPDVKQEQAAPAKDAIRFPHRTRLVRHEHQPKLANDCAKQTIRKWES